jgi:hypothetical protein
MDLVPLVSTSDNRLVFLMSNVNNNRNDRCTCLKGRFDDCVRVTDKPEVMPPGWQIAPDKRPSRQCLIS